MHLLDIFDVKSSEMMGKQVWCECPEGDTLGIRRSIGLQQVSAYCRLKMLHVCITGTIAMCQFMGSIHLERLCLTYLEALHDLVLKPFIVTLPS